MRTVDKILIARNEIENFANNLQKELGLREEEMLIAVEMALSTSRYKAITRGGYNALDAEKEAQKTAEADRKEQ